MSAATEYARILRESRIAQLEHNAAAVQRLERLLAETASQVREDIRTVPRGILGARYKRQLLSSLETTLERFREQYKTLLDDAIIEAARLAEAREQEGLKVLLQQRGELSPSQSLYVLNENARFAVAFGNVPQLVLERLYARTYKDGLNLSQRLYNLDIATRRGLVDEVASALASGKSARALAKALEAHLTQPGVSNVRYNAMRIARTEINVSYREGHIASVTDVETGKLRPYVEAIGWRLSPSHPRIDICDAWAGDDNGLGAGNYEPGDVPPGHPHCMCYTVSILTAFPEEQWASKAAFPEDVSESQRRYYGLLGEEDA